MPRMEKEIEKEEVSCSFTAVCKDMNADTRGKERKKK